MQNVKTKTLRIRDRVQITLTLFIDVEGAKESLHLMEPFSPFHLLTILHNGNGVIRSQFFKSETFSVKKFAIDDCYRGVSLF